MRGPSIQILQPFLTHTDPQWPFLHPWDPRTSRKQQGSVESPGGFKDAGGQRWKRADNYGILIRRDELVQRRQPKERQIGVRVEDEGWWR